MSVTRTAFSFRSIRSAAPYSCRLCRDGRTPDEKAVDTGFKSCACASVSRAEPARVDSFPKTGVNTSSRMGFRMASNTMLPNKMPNSELEPPTLDWTSDLTDARMSFMKLIAASPKCFS